MQQAFHHQILHGLASHRGGCSKRADQVAAAVVAQPRQSFAVVRRHQLNRAIYVKIMGERWAVVGRERVGLVVVGGGKHV